MTYFRNIDILANFEREINKIDDQVGKPATDDSLYWINQAISKFTKMRFNGNAPHYTSYEQNEKRQRDLNNLLKSACYAPAPKQKTGYLQYNIEYPEDYMFALSEDTIISDVNGGNVKPVSVFECTADSFMYRIMNSLTDFHYKHNYARPLRVRTRNGCKLLTDGNYLIHSYTLVYLKEPDKVTLDNPKAEYVDFPDYIMTEIIKIAAQMYIENQRDQRYQTISAEVNTQE